MKTFTGTVVSTRMNKTIVVAIDHIVTHPLYKKQLRRLRKIKAHSDDQTLKEGDTVTIRESRPISKDKHFVVVNDTSEKKKK